MARTVDEVPAAMAAVEDGLRGGRHAAGFVAYEAAPGFDASLTAKPPGDLPLVWFGLFDAPRETTALEHESADATDDDATVWLPDISPTDYRAGVAAVHDAILQGDSYQTNYTFRLRTSMSPRDAGALYRRLAGGQRAPYSAHLDLGRWHILSLSPELFFRIGRGVLTTRPMKGTVARGTSVDDDERRAAWLRASEKNRAENVMIVDLARNDVGRVAEIGSVRATDLFAIERYPSVFQMVSTVDGRLRPDTTLTGVFRALFPAGSITGAPKTSSMKLIASIERDPRGVYCGAIGFAAPDGEAVFNVAIRTVALDTLTGQAEFGAGGGITWDSRADDEYAEALAKTACLTPAPGFDLFETLRLQRGVYVRLDGHIARLSGSSDYFDRPFSSATIRDALEAHARQHPDEVRRVRICLDATGTPDVSSESFSGAADLMSTVVLASTPVSRLDRWLCHKTTHRTVYNHHRAAHPDAFDVLLWNEEGELTEFTIGNLVLEIDGHRWTPPVSSGLLPGVFRASLLAAGALRERVLTRADVACATRVWLINSLREWVEVTSTAQTRRRTPQSPEGPIAAKLMKARAEGRDRR
ncbi:MAG: aminodeoxychorismate synthase component I [Acidobacteriota bacterium]